MSRNVIIFSDGTGQAGGFRFDEARSNVYKLYRAVRCGPDSAINPADQIAFYDPGLGSQADGANIFGKFFRWIHNTVAQATGFGITRNLVDCYAALIQLWRPGDRIFLIGFSRGAYTVRCLAGIICRCGIPTHPDGRPTESLRIDDASARKLANEAVKHVYQFTYPRRLDEATPRQKFLLRVAMMSKNVEGLEILIPERGHQQPGPLEGLVTAPPLSELQFSPGVGAD